MWFFLIFGLWTLELIIFDLNIEFLVNYYLFLLLGMSRISKLMVCPDFSLDRIVGLLLRLHPMHLIRKHQHFAQGLNFLSFWEANREQI